VAQQQIFGQTHALARAVADWINNSTGFCLSVEAETRFHLISELPKIPGVSDPVSVDVFPGGENSDRQGISTAFLSLYTVHVYLQQQLSGGMNEQEAQCALLVQLRSDILEGLKLRKFHLTNAVHPVSNVFLSEIKVVAGETLGYNLARLLQHNVFESDSILVFKASV